MPATFLAIILPVLELANNNFPLVFSFPYVSINDMIRISHIGTVRVLQNEKLFEFMGKMYGEMQKGFKDVTEDIRKNTESIVVLEEEMKQTKKTLYDGYKQNYENAQVIPGGFSDRACKA